MLASIGADGVLLVDTGWIMTAEEVNEKIKELSDDPVKLIIFTHQHSDHIGGRSILGKQATLISHKEVQDELSGKYFALDPLPGQELPLITLDGELSLRFNGEDIRVIPAPGHTQGDMVVYFVDSGIVCMGDLLFSDSYPVVFPSYGGNVDQYLETLAWLIDSFTDNVKFIAGHGRDYTLDELKKYNEMATNTTTLIKQGIADGKSPKEMVAEKLLKSWEKWESATISNKDWITQVYESLKGQGRKSVAAPLTHTIVEKGIEAAIEQYHELKKSQPDAYDFGENVLNMLGYQLLWREMPETAINVHKLNILENPDSANPYDSLGETYEATGKIDLAIEAYEKAIAINPEMSSAVEALERLKAKG